MAKIHNNEFKRQAVRFALTSGQHSILCTALPLGQQACASRSPPSTEGLNSGLRAAKDEGVNVMGPLVSIDRLKILRMAHHMIFNLNTIAAMHVPGLAGNVERFAEIGRAHV